jgi:hypothetical protein
MLLDAMMLGSLLSGMESPPFWAQSSSADSTQRGTLCTGHWTHSRGGSPPHFLSKNGYKKVSEDGGIFCGSNEKTRRLRRVSGDCEEIKA